MRDATLRFEVGETQPALGSAHHSAHTTCRERIDMEMVKVTDSTGQHPKLQDGGIDRSSDDNDMAYRVLIFLHDVHIVRPTPRIRNLAGGFLVCLKHRALGLVERST